MCRQLSVAIAASRARFVSLARRDPLPRPKPAEGSHRCHEGVPPAARRDRVETGTWFMNRCDYLDPALAWVGVKDSGRGCTLSRVGYEHLTRPKSFHLRLRT